MGTRSKSKQKLENHVRHSVQVFLTFKHFFQLSVNSQFVVFTHTSMQITCNIIPVYFINIDKLVFYNEIKETLIRENPV